MNIAEKIKNLPESSGVYLMYDAAGNVIYVGKAVVLKNRVRQYFQNSVKLPKVQAMVDNIADFGYIITLSEKDALSLESNLVKKYNPKYNILLKDDKASPYIKIDLKEDCPTIEVTRKPKKDGAKYFGPFMFGLRVYDIVAIIKTAYKMRACPRRLPKKECLNYHIDLCRAPCGKKISKEEYSAIVNKVIAFLSGKDDEAHNIITEKMRAAVEREDFERAINYREQLNMLNKLKERDVADLKSGDDIDSIALCTDGLYSAVSVNIIRGGKMMGVKNFAVSDAGLSEDETLSSFAAQYYGQNEIPPIICFNKAFDFAAIEGFLEAKRGLTVSVTAPQKGTKKKLVDMALKNAADYLSSSVEKIKRQEDMTTGAAARLKELLGLKSARLIECYDISNLSGTDTVASGVAFLDGSPFKSGYRRYKIRTVEGIDDYASLKEVMLRRFSRDTEPPDLVVIDGGRGQLNAAHEAVNSCGISVEMISLAKRDELVYRVGKNEPIALSKTDQALRLLQRIRDEAHRFAITYNRTLRAKKFDSELLKIDGVGAKTREKIQKKLSFREVKSISASEISVRAQIDLKTAENIENYFKNK